MNRPLLLFVLFLVLARQTWPHLVKLTIQPEYLPFFVFRGPDGNPLPQFLDFLSLFSAVSKRLHSVSAEMHIDVSMRLNSLVMSGGTKSRTSITRLVKDTSSLVSVRDI